MELLHAIVLMALIAAMTPGVLITIPTPVGGGLVPTFIKQSAIIHSILTVLLWITINKYILPEKTEDPKKA